MIRTVEPGDAEALAAIYNHYILNTEATFETAPVDGAEMDRRVQAVLEIGLPWIVLEEEGRLCGYAYAVRWKSRAAYRHSVESTIYLASGVEGRGLGIRLYAETVGVFPCFPTM